MGKALLLIWIGLGQTQTMSMTVMGSMAECQAAKAALADHKTRLNSAVCIEY